MAVEREIPSDIRPATMNSLISKSLVNLDDSFDTFFEERAKDERIILPKKEKPQVVRKPD